jgi:hypothetical protein
MTEDTESGNANLNGSGILENLPPGTVVRPYEGVQQFHKVFDREYSRLESDQTGKASDMLVLTDLDEPKFTRDFLGPTEKSAIKSWRMYSPSLRLLTVIMETPAHAQAAHKFSNLLLRALKPTGLRDNLQEFGTSSVEGATRHKRPDMAWGPMRPPKGRSPKWPSVVLENAVSERKRHLQTDVDFWLNESSGDVRIVLTLENNRKGPEIIISKWELAGGRTTCTQQITIWKQEKDGQNTTVENGPLVVEFEKLFLRQPTSARETDIELDDGQLQLLSDLVWDIMGF